MRWRTSIRGGCRAAASWCPPEPCVAAVRPPAHPVYDFDAALARRERLGGGPAGVPAGGGGAARGRAGRLARGGAARRGAALVAQGRTRGLEPRLLALEARDARGQ